MHWAPKEVADGHEGGGDNPQGVAVIEEGRPDATSPHEPAGEAEVADEALLPANLLLEEGARSLWYHRPDLRRANVGHAPLPLGVVDIPDERRVGVRCLQPPAHPALAEDVTGELAVRGKAELAT